MTDPQLIANHFNDFFTSISSSIIDEINPTDHPSEENFNDDIPLFSLCNPPVTSAEKIEACYQLSPKKTLNITAVFRIRIRTDPHREMPPGSGSRKCTGSLGEYRTGRIKVRII